MPITITRTTTRAVVRFCSCVSGVLLAALALAACASNSSSLDEEPAPSQGFTFHPYGAENRALTVHLPDGLAYDVPEEPRGSVGPIQFPIFSNSQANLERIQRGVDDLSELEPGFVWGNVAARLTDICIFEDVQNSTVAEMIACSGFHFHDQIGDPRRFTRNGRTGVLLNIDLGDALGLDMFVGIVRASDLMITVIIYTGEGQSAAYEDIVIQILTTIEVDPPPQE